MGILCTNMKKPFYGTPEKYGRCWPLDNCSKSDSDSDSDSDLDIDISSKSEKSVEEFQLIKVEAMLKYERIYMKYRFDPIIGKYSYQCCAVSAMAYINAIMRSGFSRPPPSFTSCCGIAFCGMGDIMKSILMLENHFFYGIICEKVDVTEITFADTLSGSLVACFSSLDFLLSGALDINSLKYLEDSDNHLSFIVERFDFQKDCVICRKPWCPSERFEFSHFSVKCCSIFKVHSIFKH